MKKIYIAAAAAVIGAGLLASCSGKSEANKEQIENARQDAAEMTKDFNAEEQVSVTVPAGESAKVTEDITPSTEIIVSEAPAEGTDASADTPAQPAAAGKH